MEEQEYYNQAKDILLDICEKARCHSDSGYLEFLLQVKGFDEFIRDQQAKDALLIHKVSQLYIVQTDKDGGASLYLEEDVSTETPLREDRKHKRKFVIYLGNQGNHNFYRVYTDKRNHEINDFFRSNEFTGCLLQRITETGKEGFFAVEKMPDMRCLGFIYLKNQDGTPWNGELNKGEGANDC